MKLHVAIVEDEAQAAQQLQQALTRFAQQEGLELSWACFSDGQQFLRRYQPLYDIVFMDIRMPGMNGMAAAQQLRQADPVTILVFVTSMVQYAVKGYAVDAMDFIVKPVQYPVFSIKMKRVLQAVRMKQQRGILLQVEGAKQVIPLSHIQYVEVIDHELSYHTTQGVYTVRGKLGEAAQQLPAELFFRCSASHLINLRYVTRLSGEDVVLAGQTIRVSRTKRKELMAALAVYLGKGL